MNLVTQDLLPSSDTSISPSSLKITTTYTETKKFSNTSQIRIFITDSHVEINTNLIRYFLQ